MFEKILVLYDLSDPSKQALAWALRMGKPYGSGLKVIHVFSLPLIQAGRKGNFSFWNSVREIQNRINEDIRSLSGPEGMEKLKNIDIKVEIGKPIVNCLRAIYQEQPDLVVVGTHGRTGVSHVFLGSVAEKVIRHSPIPVFIARGYPRRVLKKLLLPINLADVSDESFVFGGELYRALEIKIDLIYVSPPFSLMPPLSEPLSHGDFPESNEALRSAEKQLQEIRKKNPSLPITLHLEEGPAAHQICESAKKLKSDFIVIPTHGRIGLPNLFMGSVAEHVVRYAPCPVLSFCPKKAARFKKEFLRASAMWRLS